MNDFLFSVAILFKFLFFLCLSRILNLTPRLASGLEDSTRGYAPYPGSNNYSEATTRPNASSLVRSGSDRQGNNRASNASFAEFYDSYYDNRLSTMKEENVGRI